MNTEFGRKSWGASDFKYTLQSGTRLQNGKYILIEVYGQGPFTTSYLARQNILGKKVIINEFFLIEHCSRSIKNEVINADVNETTYNKFRDKWFEEAILLAKCSGNEHFVTVLDTFEENNTAYYVTDYINEEDLKTFKRNQEGKCLDETLAINFISQISGGLSILHENNIFHLNLSPGKVLIDKNDRAVIFSVGIARDNIPVEILSDVSILTKPGYSAPELYQSDSGNGLLSDIYSLGAILYFLITGKDPLPAPERLNKPLIEPKSLNSSVTLPTNSAIMKAMAMNPEDRYHSLHDFLNDLHKETRKSWHTRTKKITFYATLALLIIAILSFITIIKINHNRPIKQLSELIYHKKTDHLDKLSSLSLNEDKTRGITLLKDADANDSLLIGNYYALLIGIDNYKDSRYQQLNEPVNDANAMYDVLVNYYTFDRNNVTVLKDPDKKEIFRLLNFYRDNLTPNDNLFIFYAGHGRYDSKSNMGYLIPIDADYINDADWISFQEIRKKFEVIGAKHILLIADACFAGSIFRGDDSNAEERIDDLTLGQLRKSSRTAFTSAYLTPVPDRSDFLKYLISTLKDNRARLLLSEDLYINTRNSLIRSTSKKDPVKWGVLQDCGDEGGDFIFIRRKNEPR